MFYKASSCITTRIADKLAQKAAEKGNPIQVETPQKGKPKCKGGHKRQK